MATERDFELLDDYVANRLGEGEKSSFEKRLEGDPDLQREHMIQQKLVKAIKDSRIAELKQMLNNTPVPAGNTGGTSVVGKIAMGTFVAGIVTTGLYFYFNHENKVDSPTEQTVTIKSEGEAITKAEPVNSMDNNTNVESSEQKTAEVKTDKSKGAALKEKATLEREKPVIDVYDPSAEAETSADVEEPASERRNSVRGGAPSIAVQVDRDNGKYEFDYQFQDGKLVLYGPFEKNLYEIMEFFSDEKRTVFLYYKERYYLLKDDNDSVKELTAITDANLIKKLKDYRGK
jgi:hypothetical protein